MAVFTSGKPLRRGKWTLAFLCFFVVLFAPAAVALSPSKSISQFAMDSWQTEAGLPELAMDAILETSDGYLWLGTQEGLTRFDGEHFTVFDHINTPALRSDFITKLVEDRQHSLWIGTTVGLVVRHADGRFERFGAENGLPIARILAAVRDNDGSVWVGGVGGLAHIVDGKVVRMVNDSNGLTNNLVTSLVIDHEGALWIIARRNLHRIKNGNVENFTDADGVKGHGINALFKSREGEVWLLSTGTGILRRVGDRFEAWWPEGVPRYINVSDIHEDRDGNIWLASDANGLFRSWQHLLNKTSAEQGLNDLGLLTLFEDSSGNLWIGTLGRGLIRLRDGSFTAFTKKEGLSADGAFSVIQDRAGDIWAGTLDGLTRISIDEVRHFSRDDGLSSNYITSLGDDPDGGIWVGLGGTKIDHIRDGKIDRKIALKTPLISGVVTSVIEDKQHRLWAGTDGGGLARYTADGTRYFTASDGVPDNFVSTLAEDADGAIWIGTSGGLGRARGDVIDPDPLHDAELRQTGILSLHIDAKDTLWIGTAARGLLRFDQNHLTRYTMQEGLPNETINSILTDGNDDLWLGSNRGIFKVGRADLDDVAAGRNAKLHVTRFGEANGMKSAETSSGEQPTAWRSNDGRLWFATAQGVVVVDPNHAQPAQRPLQTMVESIRANDTAVAFNDGKAQLPAGTSRLEIWYTAPDLTDAAATHFRYRLENVDADWIDVASERVARYTNVPPGAHRFDVQARRDNEDWSASAAAIAFNVAPLFYQTWWFLIACVLAAIALLWIFHHLRVKWLHMQSAVADERRRIAGEIHDSLAQGFSAISVQIEAALGRLDRAPDLAASHLKLARDVSRTSLSEARRSVWNLQSPSQETNLIGAIAAACEQIAYGHGVTLHTNSTGNVWPVNPAAENNLLRIAQEAVSNAIHHGAPAEIHIETMYTFNHLLLTVTDDGCGFEVCAGSQQPDRGFGLSNMQRRAQAMNGRFDVTSATGVGTRISVSIPRIALLNRLWREFRGTPLRKTP
ncbi:MAG TPA: two-component regulator propeller domain-containing protein [Rudaea sp.]|jgi:ligand-binding sensor domain-containing protein/two-component sensor histidine kinase|nr:two-component regulator propeller domain-containing protein [Rudaea sp.]